MTLIQCVTCEGADPNCEACDGKGTTEITECPMQYVGNDMIDAVNIAAMCGKGDWPIDGGLLNQSAWFLDFTQRLKHETQTIEADQRKKHGA